mmetsp:Transcript_6119/g.13399  ORF Transcript_6119/g.13399 Transcript_6119/m.13399 type:complete len:92 (-) Transcript_6119:318-593(-)
MSRCRQLICYGGVASVDFVTQMIWTAQKISSTIHIPQESLPQRVMHCCHRLANAPFAQRVIIRVLNGLNSCPMTVDTAMLIIFALQEVDRR